jgi:arabinofuranosyltransferase
MWPVRPRPRSSAFWFAAQTTLIGLIAAWAVWCASTLRVPYVGEMSDSGLADEVNFYRRLARHPNPVAPEDYRRFGAYDVGVALRELAAGGDRLLVLDEERWPLAAGPAASLVTDGIMIGLTGYLAGPAVHIADTLGLTDPIAARLRLHDRGRTGHEKSLPRDWMVGRFVAEPMMPSAAEHYPAAPAARRALGCDALRELIAAVHEPLTVVRFLRNVVLATRLTRLRVAPEPDVAAREVCGTST